MFMHEGEQEPGFFQRMFGGKKLPEGAVSRNLVYNNFCRINISVYNLDHREEHEFDLRWR